MKTIYSYSKYIIPLLLTVIMFVYWSCEEETKSEENKHPEELVGTWYSTDGDYFIEITTNSTQTIVDQFSEGVGSIDVTGEVAATLSYMRAKVYDDRIAIAVLNQPRYGYPEFPAYSMEIHDSEGYFSATFGIVNSLGEYTLFRTDTIDYSYDANTITLTINSGNFMEYDWYTGEYDSSSVVTISGTLQSQPINIPANTSTQIGAFSDPTEVTLTLEEDGVWLSTAVLNFMGETMTDTGMGTWKVEDDELIVIEKEEGYSDTLRFSYTVNSNTLTLIGEKSGCEEDDEYYTVEECLEEAEREFGLESGSLTDIISVFMTNFSKTAPTARILPKPNIGHLLQSKFPQQKWDKYHPFR